jgi:hypothetical protein
VLAEQNSGHIGILPVHNINEINTCWAVAQVNVNNYDIRIKPQEFLFGIFRAKSKTGLNPFIAESLREGHAQKTLVFDEQNAASESGHV